jgi:hypothetical protein
VIGPGQSDCEHNERKDDSGNDNGDIGWHFRRSPKYLIAAKLRGRLLATLI